MADGGIAERVKGLAARVGTTVGGLAERGSTALREGDEPLGRPAIDPQAWTPPTAPELVGPYAPNHLLANAERVPVGGHGPEDVCVAPDGTVYTGVEDGRILQLPRGSAEPERLSRVHGRPLGIELLGDDALVVCSEQAGLLEVHRRTGRVRPLVGEFRGVAFKFANNAAVHPSTGDVYFTDSTMRFTYETYMSDLFEASHTGRLFRYSVDDHELELLDSGLAFANGVALAKDASHVLYAETGTYRINRMWLTGERAGTSEVLVDNLPGFPDNLSMGPSGTLWVGLVNQRDPKLDNLLDKPAARHAVYLLPEAVRPGIETHGWVLGLDVDGTVTHNLQDPEGGGYSNVTGVREHGDRLWLASLEADAIAHVQLPEAGAGVEVV